MEQKWAYSNSSPAPPSAAPPPSRPASAFGSRRPTEPTSTSSSNHNSTGQPSYNQDLEAFPLKNLNSTNSTTPTTTSALKDVGRSPSRNGFVSDSDQNKNGASGTVLSPNPGLERRPSATSTTSNGNAGQKEKRDSFDDWGNEDDEEQIGK